MKIAPKPENELDRLEALRETRALDTPPEECFDQLTQLAARLCGAPTALITLVDVDRQWFKSKVGIDVLETPRDVAFCAFTILQDDLFVVEDAQLDERFADNPLVTENPHIRFYAGHPLVTGDGQSIGAFCVIDYVPRRIAPVQQQALRTLARYAAAMLQSRRAESLLSKNAQKWEAANASGDAAQRDHALEELGKHLRAMVGERERAGTELRRLEQQLADLEAAVSPKTVCDLARNLDGSFEDILSRATHLRELLPNSEEARRDAEEIYAAAELARTILNQAAAANGDPLGPTIDIPEL